MPKKIPSCFSACFSYITGAEKRVSFTNSQYTDNSIAEEETRRSKSKPRGTALGLSNSGSHKRHSRHKSRTSFKVDEEGKELDSDRRSFSKTDTYSKKEEDEDTTERPSKSGDRKLSNLENEKTEEEGVRTEMSRKSKDRRRSTLENENSKADTENDSGKRNGSITKRDTHLKDADEEVSTEKPRKSTDRKRSTHEYENSKSAQTERSIDIIIFGATGALGSYTVLHATSVLQGFKWGIAGRSKRNLEAVLRNVRALTDQNCDDIPIIIADANDKEALFKMAQGCQLIINCCGPYEEHAPAVIEACIAAATHYIDASIEPCFLKQVRAQFHTDAESEKIYVITSCGFFSFVVDVGINFIERHFIGRVHTVEAYSQYCHLDSRRFVPLVNCATWNTIIATMANARELISDCNKYTAPTACVLSAITTNVRSVQKLCYRSPIGQSDVVTGVAIPQPLIDAQAVKASQEFISHNEDKPPIQFRNYITFPTYFIAFLALIWCVVIFILAQTPGTREFLLKYPRLFSLGMCSEQCIEKDAAEKFVFSVTFKATGCTLPRVSINRDGESLVVSGPSPRCSSPTTGKTTVEQFEKTLKVKICGMNPFFGVGCVALLSSAITVLKQTDDLPGKGGVFTPGAAFRNTHILQEVTKHNPRFKYKIL